MKILLEYLQDTGISVRKRVIKIFRDICLEQPDFDKIPEMCVKMIRRVNDEEGIKVMHNDYENRSKITSLLICKSFNCVVVLETGQ